MHTETLAGPHLRQVRAPAVDAVEELAADALLEELAVAPQ
jgi:hypothetical protein